MSAVLEDIEDEAAEDALIRKKLDERARRRDEERSLLQQQRADRDAGRAAHVPGEGDAARNAMEQSDSDQEMALAPASAPSFAEFPGATEEVVASSLALNEQIIESTFGFKTFIFDASVTGFVDPSYDRVVRVALATGDEGKTFSAYLKPTSRVTDDAYKYHGLNGAKLDELGARDATEVLTEMLEFIEEQSGGLRAVFVGWDNAFELSCLAETLRDCQLPTTVLEGASYLDVKKVAPDAVVKVTGAGADLSKTLEELFADYTSGRHPTQHYDAEVRVAMIFVVFACLLELKGWAFDAAAALAQGPEAIPRLLEEPTVEVPDSDDALPPTSDVRRPVDCWRGVVKATGEETFSIIADGLAAEWGIAEQFISALNNIHKTKRPRPHLVQLSEKYEVEKLRKIGYAERGGVSNSRSLQDAWDKRRDGVRMTRHGYLTLARNRSALRTALKREFADMHRAALGLGPISADDTMEWFRTNYTWPQCPCVGGPLAACVKCTKCGKCVREGNGQAFEHSELTDTELAEIPGGFQMLLERGVVPAAAGAGAAAARARIPPKILVAFHRLLPTCNKCNWRVVDYVDRLGLGKVPGMAARRRAVKAHTDACAKMAGV